jgi:hypothetical protein
MDRHCPTLPRILCCRGRAEIATNVVAGESGAVPEQPADRAYGKTLTAEVAEAGIGNAGVGTVVTVVAWQAL